MEEYPKYLFTVLQSSDKRYPQSLEHGIQRMVVVQSGPEGQVARLDSGAAWWVKRKTHFRCVLVSILVSLWSVCALHMKLCYRSIFSISKQHCTKMFM